MSNPNPYDDVGPWNQISFAGIPCLALLTKLDDVETKDEWKKQKSKESSGQVNVFAGTTVTNPKCTLEAPDKESFDDLWRLWNALKPVPGLGGTTPAATTAAASGYTSTVGSPSAAAGTTAASTAAINEVNANGNGSSDKSATTNPGPRPPTVSVQNAILAWHGIFAVARGSWKGPTPTDTNSWTVEIELVVQKPPTPAGAGAMAPATPAASGGAAYASTGGAGSTGGAASPQGAAQTNAAQQAAGT